MFIWDFAAIFAVGLIFLVGLVLALWIRYNSTRAGEQKQESVSTYFRHCHFCGYVYLDYAQKSPCRCPRCLSYHDEERYGLSNS